MGNSCDIDYADALEYLETDPDTKIIALHIEGIKDGKRFIEVARRVANKKPIMVLKSGKSDLGAKAVASHSGSMTGDDKMYDVAFKKAGLIRVNSFEEFGDIANGLLNLPLMAGNRVGIVTPTGAGGIVGVDVCQNYGFEIATLSRDSIKHLRPLFPSWFSLKIPFDILPASILNGYKKVYSESLLTLLQDDNVDGVLCVGGGRTVKIIDEVYGKCPHKPLVSWIIGKFDKKTKDLLEDMDAKLFFSTPQQAVRVLAALRDYHNFLKYYEN